MHYLVIEHFRAGAEAEVYRRFAAHGRLAPQGLAYVTSWVTTDIRRCYQVMETDDRHQLETWMAAWADLIDFEVHEVMTSAAAAALMAPRR